MDTVYDLWYVRGYTDREDTKLLIGIFSSTEKAEEAITELSQKPGFADWPEGFEIHHTKLDHCDWPAGFKSIVSQHPEDAPLEAFDMPYWPDSGSGA
ncbi:MAG: hypothetical protein WCD42_00865 [Rhizomicrobium sp.]